MDEKPRAHIEDWAFLPKLNKLAGMITKHPRNRGDKPEGGLTSHVVKLDRENRICETTNTIYILGEEAQEIG